MPNDYNIVPPSYGCRGPQHFVGPLQESRNRDQTNFNRPPMYLHKTLVIMCQEQYS